MNSIPGKNRDENGRRMIFYLKQPRYRNQAYLDWVKGLPSAFSRIEPAGDAHHIIGVGGLSGMGLTAPDWAAMPLTRDEHNLMHRDLAMWPEQWEYIARTLGRAIEEGKLKWVK